MLDDLVARDPTPGSAVMVPMAALSTGEALGMWIMGGVFERFPGLKVVFVEPGLGWIAWWLFITDDMVTRQGYDLPAITELPSFYFHRNVFVTFIDETDAITAPQLRNRIGIENMMWSSDYPHPVTSWPNSRQRGRRDARRAHRRPNASWSSPATHGASGTCEDAGHDLRLRHRRTEPVGPGRLHRGPAARVPRRAAAHAARVLAGHARRARASGRCSATPTSSRVAREPVLFSASEGGVVLEDLDAGEPRDDAEHAAGDGPAAARRLPAPARAAASRRG